MVHSDSDILQIDPERTKVTKINYQGYASEVKVVYQTYDSMSWGKEYYRILLAEELQPNKHNDVIYKVEFYFTGKLLNAGDKGFYTTKDGGGDIMASTLFSMVFARKAFPCFDEPDLKAEFEITLVYPDGYTPVTNMPSIGPTTVNI